MNVRIHSFGSSSALPDALRRYSGAIRGIATTPISYGFAELQDTAAHVR